MYEYKLFSSSYLSVAYAKYKFYNNFVFVFFHFTPNSKVRDYLTDWNKQKNMRKT